MTLYFLENRLTGKVVDEYTNVEEAYEEQKRLGDEYGVVVSE